VAALFRIVFTMAAPQLAGSALEGIMIKYYKSFSHSRLFECSNRLCEKFRAADVFLKIHRADRGKPVPRPSFWIIACAGMTGLIFVVRCDPRVMVVSGKGAVRRINAFALVHIPEKAP
jgi:hypothetical protein